MYPPQYNPAAPEPTDGPDLSNLPDDDTPERASMTDRFLAFHGGNPQVYRTLVQLAHEWRRSGKYKCGIEMLWNTCRWRLTMDTQGDEAFELNNDFKAFYARALMHFEKDLRNLFDLRRAPEADAWIATYQDKAAA